eukprot:TRINITY_DN4295_c0_g1_i1.p1 TRINITY_DN4295_c0_g1~~TRINITY_DN4295_c0_g1_i1.p1  ORF type:complete len:466 (+),score=58.52 TRINITY_DN4295_c0_g1_i1:1502-2899(+)
MLLLAGCFVALAAVPCWESEGERWAPGWIAAGSTAFRPLGAGCLVVDCFGGVVTSTGGAPVWEAMLIAEDSQGNTTHAVTYLMNSSTPYYAKVFNAEATTKWTLAIQNLNHVRQISINVTITVMLSPTPIPVPPPEPVSYDEPTAKVALVYSSAAYAIPENVKQWDLNQSCRDVTQGFSLVNIFDGLNNSLYTPFGYVGLDYDRAWIVVAFKGTNGTKDTVADLIQIFSGATYYQTKCDINEHISGNTHAGFCPSYKVMQSLGLLSTVLQLMTSNPRFSVLVTGHSLGGALGTLFHADLISTLKATNPAWVQRVVSYSFGQPRVGGAGLAFNLPQMFRVVHADDCVPHLCPCCASGIQCLQAETCPYHVAQEVWYPRVVMAPENYTMCDPNDGEDPRCSNSQTVTLSVQNHLYYFGMKVGDYCYNPSAYKEYAAREQYTHDWLQSLTPSQKERRIHALRGGVNDM